LTDCYLPALERMQNICTCRLIRVVSAMASGAASLRVKKQLLQGSIGFGAGARPL